jgi:hypothetical protein
MLDRSLLESFSRSFFGYGTLDSDYWFVGMEEGGGKTEVELRHRLQRWKDLGASHTLDNYEFHRGVKDDSGSDLGYLFQPGAPLQRTWKGLIRIYLAASDKRASSVEDVRCTQIHNWGRDNSDNCLLELLPLPSPGTGIWNYNEWSDLAFLRDRRTYAAHFTEFRSAAINQMMRKYRPRVVVFYSTTYIDQWRKISGVDFNKELSIVLDKTIDDRKLIARFKKTRESLLVNCYHSTSHGVTNRYFDRIGDEILVRAD